MPRPKSLPFTGDPEADKLLAADPLALLIGMLLDQQVPMEWAFRGPQELKRRLEGRLDAAEIAVADPEELRRLFSERPALHRYPGSMASRVQALCQAIVDGYGGKADRIWKSTKTAGEVFDNLKALPGYGEQKARIFLAILGKRLGVAPAGWEELAGAYGSPGYWSIADVDGPGALEKVRAHKREMKAAAKAGAAGAGR